jgi:hypothetical protein
MFLMLLLFCCWCWWWWWWWCYCWWCWGWCSCGVSYWECLLTLQPRQDHWSQLILACHDSVTKARAIVSHLPLIPLPTWTHLGRSWKRWESVMSTALFMHVLQLTCKQELYEKKSQMEEALGAIPRPVRFAVRWKALDLTCWLSANDGWGVVVLRQHSTICQAGGQGTCLKAVQWCQSANSVEL